MVLGTFQADEGEVSNKEDFMRRDLGRYWIVRCGFAAGDGSALAADLPVRPDAAAARRHVRRSRFGPGYTWGDPTAAEVGAITSIESKLLSTTEPSQDLYFVPPSASPQGGRFRFQWPKWPMGTVVGAVWKL